MRAFYTEEQFKAGRKVLVVCNLKPAKMAGFESAGMVLCAANAEHTEVGIRTDVRASCINAICPPPA